ncbi:hypothetical protein Golomagni_00610 [Golovinomyces magnicellulatus]|nr:hypothetical protein Golomagni_00610 [Golovinomyces magnicellulatus]
MVYHKFTTNNRIKFSGFLITGFDDVLNSFRKIVLESTVGGSYEKCSLTMTLIHRILASGTDEVHAYSYGR